MLYQIIKTSITNAMKSGEKQTVSFFRYIDSQIQNVVMDKRMEFPSDEIVISILQKEQKKINEEMEYIKKSNRQTDKLLELEHQLKLINIVLPKEIPESDLSNWLDNFIKREGEEVSMKLMGKIIKEINETDNRILNKNMLSKLLKQRI
ncbi:MAG: GatB/YqeY domain-containing protein [bacterium]